MNGSDGKDLDLRRRGMPLFCALLGTRAHLYSSAEEAIREATINGGVVGIVDAEVFAGPDAFAAVREIERRFLDELRKERGIPAPDENAPAPAQQPPPAKLQPRSEQHPALARLLAPIEPPKAVDELPPVEPIEPPAPTEKSSGNGKKAPPIV